MLKGYHARKDSNFLETTQIMRMVGYSSGHTKAIDVLHKLLSLKKHLVLWNSAVVILYSQTRATQIEKKQEEKNQTE